MNDWVIKNCDNCKNSRILPNLLCIYDDLEDTSKKLIQDNIIFDIENDNLCNFKISIRTLDEIWYGKFNTF